MDCFDCMETKKDPRVKKTHRSEGKLVCGHFLDVTRWGKTLSHFLPFSGLTFTTGFRNNISKLMES
jgi:hypothetical protein